MAIKKISLLFFDANIVWLSYVAMAPMSDYSLLNILRNGDTAAYGPLSLSTVQF